MMYTKLYEGTMKNLARSALAAGALSVSALAGPQTDLPKLGPIIAAIYDVETLGQSNRATAVGDNGNAKGSLQIWPAVIADVNRIYKTNYTHDDMFDPDKSIDVARKYLTYWGKQYTKKTNKLPTAEIYARIWNGGPNGWKRTGTLPYWQKVQKYL